MNAAFVRRHAAKRVAFVTLVVIAAVFLLRPSNPAEPTYKGKTMAQWAEQYERDGTPEEAQQARAAIRAMCTNDIPALLAAIAYDDTPRKRRINALVGWLPRPIQNRLAPMAFADRKVTKAETAAAALRALGPSAAPAIPGLVTLMAATNANVSYRAIYTLSRLGTNGLTVLLAAAANPAYSRRIGAVQAMGHMAYLGTNVTPALPVLLQCAQDQDRILSRIAVTALAQLAADTTATLPMNSILPAVCATLTDPDPFTRGYGIDLLLQIGPPARHAAPALLNAFQDPDDHVRRKATNALRRIAPDLLTNAPAQ